MAEPTPEVPAEDAPCPCAFCTGLVETLRGHLILMDAGAVIGWAQMAQFFFGDIEAGVVAAPADQVTIFDSLVEAAAEVIKKMQDKVEEAMRSNPDGRWN